MKLKTFINLVENKINNQMFNEAYDLIIKRFGKSVNINNKKEAEEVAILSGFLIDIGSEGKVENAAIKGISLFEENFDILKKYYDESSLEYNLGNGKAALFDIDSNKKNFQFNPKSITLLLEAKNHYWKSYKLSGGREKKAIVQNIINLANTLQKSGRIVEALNYYEVAIKDFPFIGNAYSGRAACLSNLKKLSGSYSINMLWKMAEDYKKASTDEKLPEWVRKNMFKSYELYKNYLTETGYNDDEINHDIKITETEKNSHTEYRKYCLDNHLTLSEHSLYCNCIGARRDDLTIPSSSFPIIGEFVPKMEQFLNRIKSEFVLSRYFFYKAEINEKVYWAELNKETTYSELKDNEMIGFPSELYRTTFRLCFGILDKIARAICNLFYLAEISEQIYFESFWNQKKKKDRWEKINLIDNVSLVALYSQASDLNKSEGEWGIFKSWRNNIEHNLLILTNIDNLESDKYGLMQNNDSNVVAYDNFKDKTYYLLKLTRSAIFNFVFCVRQEGLKLKSNTPGQGLTVTLENKEL